jgi:hypothetical protein
MQQTKQSAIPQPGAGMQITTMRSLILTVLKEGWNAVPKMHDSIPLSQVC